MTAASIEWRDLSRSYQAEYPDSYLAHFPDVVVDDTTALMSQRDLDRLDDYSGSAPTGVYLGKCWKCRYGGGWLLRWYGWPRDGTGARYASINTRRIEVVR